MGIKLVTGPPFSGKSQKVAEARQPGDVLFDTTALWRAFKDPEQTERSEEDARIAMAMMRRGLEVAVEQGRDGWVIVAMRAIAKLRKWLAAADAAKAILVSDVPWKELEKRAKARGPSCEAILDKWAGYEDDADLREVTEPWEDDAMRTAEEVETQYRAALDECAVRVGPELVQMRCLTDRAELRADMDSRTVTGVAVRYGDEAMVYGIKERIARGALTLPTGPTNLTLQHDRGRPVAMVEWQDDEDAMRFRATFPPGARQDQTLGDMAAGLWRGASLEFIPKRQKPVEMGDNPVVEIVEAKLLNRLAIVDDGAYPQSKVARMPMPEAKPKPEEERPGEHTDRATEEGALRITMVEPAKPKRRGVDRRFLVAC